jgi:hypothetical protein
VNNGLKLVRKTTTLLLFNVGRRQVSGLTVALHALSVSSNPTLTYSILHFPCIIQIRIIICNCYTRVRVAWEGGRAWKYLSFTCVFVFYSSSFMVRERFTPYPSNSNFKWLFCGHGNSRKLVKNGPKFDLIK